MWIIESSCPKAMLFSNRIKSFAFSKSENNLLNFEDTRSDCLKQYKDQIEYEL
jgi:hypothetical protein